jgi:hypothetical protein
MMNNYLDDKAKLKQAKHDAAQLTIFHNWIQEPQNQQWDYQAAHEMIKNYLDGTDMTSENLTWSAEQLAAEGVIKPREDYQIKEDAEAQDIALRGQLIRFIMDNRKMSDDTRRSEFARLSSKLTTTETLQTIADNIKRARLSEQELKKQADEEFKAQQAAHGIRPGRWQPVPEIMRHKEMLKAASAEELRSLAARCGWDQLNAILQTPDEE